MDRAFQRIRSLMLRGTFYSVPPIFCRVLFIMAGSMDMGHIRIFHDARNDQVMMSIEVSFIYTFFFPVNVGCVRVCLGLIILFILFFRI